MTVWVGIDGSKQSRNVLYWALRFAKAAAERSPSDDAIVLQPVMCWHYPSTASGSAISSEPKEIVAAKTTFEAERVMNQTGLLPPDGVVVAEPLVIQGKAADVLVEKAESTDLLVVGSRGLGGFRGLVLGSVSSRVAGRTRCPVAIIPPHWSPTKPPSEEVVVGIDRSGPSTAAATWAVRHHGAETTIRLVHSWSVPPLAGLEALHPSEAQYEHDAAALVESCAKLVKPESANPDAVKAVAVRGDPRSVLRAEAADADLLVLGAQRFHGLERALFGSVAQSVIHHLNAPTVLVPSEQDLLP